MAKPTPERAVALCIDLSPRTLKSVATHAFALRTKALLVKRTSKTSNRTELCAVIAALQFRAWYGEGCKRLVIAADSEYVVEGATSWVHAWLRRAWKTSTGAAVKNRDLWEYLLGWIAELNSSGMEVKIWRVPRELNAEADHHARLAASEDAVEEFSNVMGVHV
ncbi:ribonuclease H-like domain-containing protein [Aspergillus aurantiobrunneus]